MADVACETKCSATNLLNYSTSNELLECAKCAALQFQLQQVREELSSVHLIIQLLNKEHVQGTTVATPIQTTESRWKVDKAWEVMTQRRTKKGAEGNINLRKTEVLSLKGQAVVASNRYAALEADSRLLRNEDGLETIYRSGPNHRRRARVPSFDKHGDDLDNDLRNIPEALPDMARVIVLPIPCFVILRYACNMERENTSP